MDLSVFKITNYPTDFDIATLVDADFSDYRRKNENRAVKKNLTIPSWLNEEATRAGVNKIIGYKAVR